jgi:hypothetical protein
MKKKTSTTILNIPLFWCVFGTISNSRIRNMIMPIESTECLRHKHWILPTSSSCFLRKPRTNWNSKNSSVHFITEAMAIHTTLFSSIIWSRMLLPFAHSPLPQTNWTLDCVITVLCALHYQKNNVQLKGRNLQPQELIREPSEQLGIETWVHID